MYFGATRMSYRKNMIAGTLGFLPGMILATLLGSSVQYPNSPAFWISSIFIDHRFTNKPFAGEAVHSIVGLLLAIMLLIDPLGAGKHHLLILGLELICHSLKLFIGNREY